MASFIIYVFRWGVALTLLYSLYGLLMKRETLHGVNRVVLLLILVASMVLPFIQTETKEPNYVTQGREILEQQIILEERIVRKEGDFWATDANREYAANMERITNSKTGYDPTPLKRYDKDGKKKGWTWFHTLLLLMEIYVFGLVVYWIRYLWQLASLILLIRRGRKVNIDGLPRWVRAITHPDVKTPCSWMRWMILNPSDTGTRAIIDHELAHIRLRHSWDMLLCEFSCRMLWCVPFAWMLRQDLRDVHEFQADRRVLKGGVKDEEYQLLLIRKATGTGVQPIVNAFNQSSIKRRFKMMYKKPSRRWMALKAAYLLPLCGLAQVAFAHPRAMDEIEDKIEQAGTAFEQMIHDRQHENNAGGQTVGDSLVQMVESRVAQSMEQGALSDDSVVTFGDAYLVLDQARVPRVDTRRTPVEVLDSTMVAIGARRIGEGVYVGAFKPNYTSDTIRVRKVSLCDTDNLPTAEFTSANNVGRGSYVIDLQVEDRDELGRGGYHLRSMTCDAPTQAEFHDRRSNTLLGQMLTPANITFDEWNKGNNFYVEQYPDETHVIVFSQMVGNDGVWEADLDVKDICIEDAKTGDRYMCRYVKSGIASPDPHYQSLHLKSESHDNMILQFTYVFPPLDKRVRFIRLGDMGGNDFKESYPVYRLKDVVRKPKRIIE